jgi:Ca2+-binding RTX toxin-like protein
MAIDVFFSFFGVEVAAKGQALNLNGTVLDTQPADNPIFRGLDPQDIPDTLIYRLTGNDYIEGAGFNDTVFAAAGDDVILGEAGNDQLFGDQGDDVIFGGLGSDLIHGVTGDDALTGDAGHDTIFGELGADQLIGGDGADSLRGGTNDDELEGNADNDVLHGGAGDDVLSGDEGNDTASGSYGADGIEGGEGNDSIAGGPGNDFLEGNAGFDRVSGGAGDDHIVMSSTDGSQDYYSGGAGRDFFEFDGVNTAAAKTDICFDFAQSEDKLVISLAAFVLENPQFRVISASVRPAGSPTHSTLFYDTDTFTLFFDEEGGAAQYRQILGFGGNAPAALAATDFDFTI